MPMTHDEIFTKIQGILADALAIDTDEVAMDSRLTSDLGAESIDFLDIAFKLEQAFGIKINQGELFPENLSQNPKYAKDGKVTPDGLAELKARLPHINFAGFEKDPQLSKLGELFTVRVLVMFVAGKLAK
jgi:acyl carrier protein